MSVHRKKSEKTHYLQMEEMPQGKRRKTKAEKVAQEQLITTSAVRIPSLQERQVSDDSKTREYAIHPEKYFTHGAPSTSKRCNVFPPRDGNFKVSRSTYEKFLKCPSCFLNEFRDEKQLKPDGGFGLSVYAKVDKILKEYFDIYRELEKPHPLMTAEGSPIPENVIPLKHELLETWRSIGTGIRHNLEIEISDEESVIFECFGAIDDIWYNPETKEYHIVDYKLTSTAGTPNLSKPWQKQYLRQLEYYTWLFRKAGFNMSNKAYIVYYNLPTDIETYSFEEIEEALSPEAIDKKQTPGSLGLQLSGTILEHSMDLEKIDEDVTRRLCNIYSVLTRQVEPIPSRDCDHCNSYYSRLLRSHSRDGLDEGKPDFASSLDFA